MKRHIIFIYVFLICFTAYATEPMQCPDLGITAHWKLDKDTIIYQSQKWYISHYWSDERTDSGGTLPVPAQNSDLTHVQSIKFLNQLEPGMCRYQVTIKNKPSSKLVIKHMSE